MAVFPMARRTKVVNWSQILASVLGLVPPIINQVYTTKGLRMRAQEATQSLQEPKAWVGAL